MGVSGINVCFCVAYWIRSVQSRVGGVKQSLASALVPERQKELDLESAMIHNDDEEEEEKLLLSELAKLGVRAGES
ncbi:hypothetical protein PG993_004608 [Apiospora rasikravindrae]|uniref:Uncharacterized protein n=1 Tax=Apiospora rasikravindrae TaxID=990691 RepID=A0ABR1TFS4_9PEZI